MGDLSVSALALYKATAGGMQSERYIPFLGPCRTEEQRTVGGFLKQHLLQTYHGGTTAVAVGSPIKTLFPESRETERTVCPFLYT